MENVLDKLKVLDYETTFCVKHHVTPLARTSFALPAKVRYELLERTHGALHPKQKTTLWCVAYSDSTHLPSRILVSNSRTFSILYRGYAAR